MKNFYLPSLLPLCVIALLIFSCTLEKEPDIPTNVSNIIDPVFSDTEVTTDTNYNFWATARLSDLGNLNIMKYGWVWSETPTPTLINGSLIFDNLLTDSFSTKIPGLDVGKIYYFRPYVTTGAETFYGPEQCSFLGVKFIVNEGTKIYQGMKVQFTNLSTGNYTYSWDFGDRDTSTLNSPTHIYDTIGNVTVQLTAYKNGCPVMQTTVLEIVDPFPDDYMVFVPGGSFMMGCTSDQQPECLNDEPDEIPAHPVTVNSFRIGKTEVTQAQWLAIMGDGINPSKFNNCGLDCPVENVSWNDVKVFLNKLNATLPTGVIPYRLPTEAEWEYAARGGANVPNVTKYAGSNNLDNVAWYGQSSTDTVAQLEPNGLGLYDMSGNVWEFVEDDYHFDSITQTGYIGAPQNGTAWVNNPPSDTCVNRGGSWRNGIQSSHRTANRGYSLKGNPLDSRGFRLARDY